MREVSVKNVTMSSLAFKETQFDIIDRNGQVWLRSPQIAKALGYADASSINRIYARNADEFTDQMTGSVKLTDPNGALQETRIFSLRGAHLIAMLSNAKAAKEFRRWVLDILDERSSAQSSQPQSQPAVGSKAWQYEREAGKVQRLSLTDTIRDYLIPLATEQGSSSPKMLYQVYSQMINRVLGYPAGQRDVMAVADLNRLEAAEEFAAQQIIKRQSSGSPAACRSSVQSGWR